MDALLDSNVLVAAAESAHPHHRPSEALFAGSAPRRFAVAGHSLAETYVTLTRPTAYGWPPEEARAAVASFAADVVLVGLTPAQTLDAVISYASSSGIGARLYDRLIGEAAVRAGLRRIVTWNVGHMRSLFPALDVLTPADVLAA